MLVQAQESTNPWVQFNDWGHHFVEKLPMLITAFVFMMLVIFLSRYVKRIAIRLLSHRAGNPAIATVMASFISIIFITIGIFITLGILGLDQTVSSLLAGAGILGLVLGLALQDTLSSAVAGIIMTTRKSYKVGDFVESNGYLGTIVELNLRNTTVRLTTGSDVKIPNKLVFNNPLINYTLTGEVRIDINIGIYFDENLQLIETILRTAFKDVTYNKNRDLEIFFTDMSDGYIKVLIRFWISKFKQADQLQAKNKGIIAIKSAFDVNGIKVPFPFPMMDSYKS